MTNMVPHGAAPMLLDLPPELLLPILTEALAGHPSPIAVLSTCRRIRELGEPLLYRHLTLRSTKALILSGGEVGSGQMAMLCPILYQHINALTPGGCIWNEHISVKERLRLDRVGLCMNSQSSPAKDDTELSALGIIDPTSFTWIGPDPPHQFSTAIVPDACTRVFAHAVHWSSLRTLFLSNVAFPSSRSPDMSPSSSPPTSIFTSPAPVVQEIFAFPVMPALERMDLRNATFLPIKALAKLVCDDRTQRLSHVGLQDCYVESIWGERVRRSHLERITQEFEGGRQPERIGRVRVIVVCSAMYERIEGGDRVTVRGDEQGAALLE
ncbi:unnamed protein product [Peniophora sp. CBMAI 1063]|nr:unnamed protein product [Peniophora sp. CBMAI 1063]